MRSIIIIISCITLIACQTNRPKESAGTLIGGATGAVIGSQIGKGKGQIASVAIGTLLGAMVGNTIGRQMDEHDRAMANRTAHYVLETQPDNTRRAWRNPNTNHHGDFTVTRTTEYPDSHQICRDFQQTVTIDGQQEVVHGRACRDALDPNGKWVNQ